jgi:hypothetical protein
VRWFNHGCAKETEDGALVAHPDQVWYRLSLDPSEPWKKIALVRQPDAALAGLVSDAAYDLHNAPLPLAPEKIADLAKFKAWIPAEYHALYPDPVAAGMEEEEGEGELDEDSPMEEASDSEDGEDADEEEVDLTAGVAVGDQ